MSRAWPAGRLPRLREQLHPTDPTYGAEPLDIEDARWLLQVAVARGDAVRVYGTHMECCPYDGWHDGHHEPCICGLSDILADCEPA